MSATTLFLIALASGTLWALLAWVERLEKVCVAAFVVAVAFALAGVLEADLFDSGASADPETWTAPDGRVYERPDNCVPGDPYPAC